MKHSLKRFKNSTHYIFVLKKLVDAWVLEAITRTGCDGEKNDNGEFWEKKIHLGTY